jgi:hypothetical protein|nr:MAG TPA: hypothetical protein [Caudoviricetes sp.]
MNEKKFFELVKNLVADYTNELIAENSTLQVSPDDVYVVWFCKTLQNWKALASTTLVDGMYYELTLNGDKQEIYLDAYKKFENRAIKVEG